MCVTPVGSRPGSDDLEGLKSERKPQPCGPASSPMDRCYGCLENPRAFQYFDKAAQLSHFHPSL